MTNALRFEWLCNMYLNTWCYVSVSYIKTILMWLANALWLNMCVCIFVFDFVCLCCLTKRKLISWSTINTYYNNKKTICTSTHAFMHCKKNCLYHTSILTRIFCHSFMVRNLVKFEKKREKKLIKYFNDIIDHQSSRDELVRRSQSYKTFLCTEEICFPSELLCRTSLQKSKSLIFAIFCWFYLGGRYAWFISS